jgi:ATP-dependent Lon protease
MRKVARRVVEGRRSKTRITPKNLETFLGVPKYLHRTAQEQDAVGIATGLVWRSVGGDLLTIEVTLAEGRGGLMLTGRLGEVMKESGQAALAYIRSHAKALGIETNFYERRDIHVHAPEGGQAKEGPSAGITIATAMISALTKRPVRRNVAMTGEITIHGQVLPIGGLKEKVLAAHRAGITTIVLPKRNEKDLEDIPEEVQKQVKLIFVERMEQVLEIALHPMPADAQKAGQEQAKATREQAAKKERAQEDHPSRDGRHPKPRLRRAPQRMPASPQVTA